MWPLTSGLTGKVLVAQSCPTICDIMDCSPPGASVCGVLQARILDGLPCPSPEDLSYSSIEPGSPALQADSFPSEPPGEPLNQDCLASDHGPSKLKAVNFGY